MSQIITWQTCFYSVINQHFNASYVSVYLVIAAAACLFSYYAFQVLYERTALKEKISEERAETICQTLIQVCALLLVAFLVYFFFFFKPDAVQASVNNLTLAMGRGEFGWMTQ